MEEKRKGQEPEAEIARSDQRTAQRTATPAESGPGTHPEDPKILADAQARAAKDKRDLRRKGFGDHKGGDIS